MRIIGLTGGIATGKSTVAAMLAVHGAAVVDADQIAREVVEPGTPGLEAVVGAFGRGLLTPSGRLDRAGLANIVFADPASRRRLEALTHPLILSRIAERVAALVASGPPLIAVDVPLLFEGDRQSDFPGGVLLVYADAATQLRRLRERGGLGEVAARQRLAAQLPIDRKRDLATWVIDNGGSRTDTERAVDLWWRDNVDVKDPDDPMPALGSDPATPADAGAGG
ncbi:MAG: dephospho-CoA kinase [Candidatus Dormibacteria bacterium]